MSETPSAFSLHQNYPNPFNPSTAIQFDLPEAAQVRIRVFDLLGREVSELVHASLDAGTHVVYWNAAVSSGSYLCRMESTTAEGQVVRSSRRMLLVR